MKKLLFGALGRVLTVVSVVVAKKCGLDTVTAGAIGSTIGTVYDSIFNKIVK